MKTLKVTNRSRVIRDIVAHASEEDVIVQTPDGVELYVSVVDDFAHEVAMQRKNKKLMAFLKERFRKAREGPRISHEELGRRLGLRS